MKTPWDAFFEDRIRRIFAEKKAILDIGGGLRVAKEKNNRFDPRRAWIIPLLKHVDYKIMDPVPDYHPDIVGDIHAMPFKDNSQEAVISMAVLEHVEDPIRAAKEMHRVLKPGGYCFVYVPFLYYYHAEVGYYADYWRFTADSLKFMFKDFSKVEVQSVRGAFGTWIRLSPLGRFRFMEKVAYYIDRITGKLSSKQVSGYHVFLVK